MAAYILPNIKQQYFDLQGNPLVGGKVWTYAPGTNDLKATYADAAMTVPNTNPVILDARGEALIYWYGAYSVRLEDRDGAVIDTVDRLSPSVDTEAIDAAVAVALGYADDAADSASASAVSATASAGSATASAASATAAAGAAATAQGYAEAVGANRGLFDSTADALSNGVNVHTITGNGSGGTNGTGFVGTYAGTTGSEGTFSFSVSGGAIVPGSVVITSPGKNYTGTITATYTGAGGSAGLTGVTATIGIGPNASLGESIGVRLPAPNPRLYQGYKIVAGPSAQPTNDAPSIDAVTGTYKITQTISAVVSGLPTTYPRYVRMMAESGGTLHVLEMVNDTDAFSFERLVSIEYVRSDTLSFESAVRGLPTTYPTFIKLIADNTGDTRVLESLTDTEYMVGAGGGGSSSGQVGYSPVPLMSDIILSIGQSNEDSRGDGPAVSVPTGIGKFYNFNTGTIDEYSGAEPNSALSSGSFYTGWGAFINEYYRRTGRGVVLVCAAKGGTSMQDDGTTDVWDPATIGILTSRAVNRVLAAQALATTAGIAWRMGCVSFCQGENDAQLIDAGTPGFTKAGYKAAFGRMVTALRAGLGAKLPILIKQTGYKSGVDTTGFQQIRAAQVELADATPDCYLATNFAKNFFSNGRMKADLLHFNQLGQNDECAYTAVVAAAVL